jgi:hypothetical protein
LQQLFDLKKRSPHLGAGQTQQFCEDAEALAPEVPKLPAVGGLDGIIQAAKKLQTFGGDASPDGSPVFGLATARDQSELFEAVKQAGDVGVPGNHSAGDFSTGQAFGRAAQDAEDVVLSGRDILGFENLNQPSRQEIGGAHKFEKGGFFGRSMPGAPGGFDSSRRH